MQKSSKKTTKSKAREWDLLVWRFQYCDGDEIMRFHKDPKCMPGAKWVRVREVLPRKRKVKR